MRRMYVDKTLCVIIALVLKYIRDEGNEGLRLHQCTKTYMYSIYVYIVTFELNAYIRNTRKPTLL